MTDSPVPVPVSPPKRSLSNAIRWGGTLVALGLLVYLLATQDWAEFWKVLSQIPVTIVAAVLGLMLLSRVAVCIRWYVLLRSGGLPVTAWQCVRLTFAGLFSSNFLPSTIGGDAIRLAGAIQMEEGLLRSDGSAAPDRNDTARNDTSDPQYSAIVAASLVADRLIGMAGMTTLLPMGLSRLINGVKPLSQSGLGILPYALVGVALPNWFCRAWDWGWHFVQDALRSLVHWLRQPKALLGALFWTYVHMACLFTTLWLLLTGMGQHISWWMVGSLWVFNYFASLLPVAVNGLGVQELAISYLYTRFGGVSAEAGLALALLIRFLYVLVSLPGAAFLPGLLPRDKK